MEKAPGGSPVGVDDPYEHVGRCDHLTDEGSAGGPSNTATTTRSSPTNGARTTSSVPSRATPTRRD